MTIEKLLELSADELERMSDEELTEALTPYFSVTRPKQNLIPVVTKPKKQDRKAKKKTVNEVLGLIKQLGIEI